MNSSLATTKNSNSRRKNLTLGKRFEILKRDLFTCQYCGASAPDVELHVDHIHPVSRGGTNNELNLVTACKSCNLAKRDQPLPDDALSKVAKIVEQNQGRYGKNKKLIDEVAKLQRWRETELARLRILVAQLQGEGEKMRNEIEWQRNMLSWKNKLIVDREATISELKEEVTRHEVMVKQAKAANLWQRIFKTW